MKTSIKLLVAFTAILVVMMLVADIVLWANYRKRNFKDDYPKVQWGNKVPTQPFKYLVLSADTLYTINVDTAADYGIQYFGEHKQNIDYSQKGDTMYLHIKGPHNTQVYCPAIAGIKLTNVDVIVSKMNVPSLTVTAADGGCRIHMNDMHLSRFAVKGGERIAVDISSNCTIDSLQLDLGRNGIINSYDVPYKYMDLNVENIDQLNLEGRSLKSLKKLQ